MSDLKPWTIREPKNLYAFTEWLKDNWKRYADKGKPLVLTVKEETRTIAQNSLMWVVLKQLEPIDWYGHHLTKEEWKDVITAALKGHKAVPGIDGGFVILGARTSTMTIAEMGDVIEAAYALGSSRKIQFMERAS